MSDNLMISAETKQMVLGYKSEAMDALSEADSANNQFKELVTAAAETTKLPKGIISKYFKTCYADKVKQLTDEAEVIGFLNE